ncbi:PREDICTED: T-cell surface glycoprotein CD4-like, partial [Apaloderma vittatum]|uniref:T-cell surface glycoprotein CD4-like n=1 Tax=Apaloderma vittatum TaxID=57397 RepID=UPI0005212311
MELYGTVVSSAFAIFLLLHLGLIPITAQENEVQIGIAGQDVILNCRGISDKTGVTWKYYKSVIRLLKGGYLKGRAPMAHRSEINLSTKHLKVSNLSLSDAGIYTCEYDSHTVSISLHVFKLTISSDGHFLPNDTLKLTLMQNSSHPLHDLSITLFNSSNDIVRPKLLQNKGSQEYMLELEKLKTTDNGTWVCHIHSDSPLINQNISFDVKVLGFQNPDLEIKYATIDTTVILAWHLNFQNIKWEKGFTGQVNQKQQESVTSRKLCEFNVPEQGKQHKTESSDCLTGSVVKEDLPKVQFNNSGQYQCQLEYNGKYVQSKIELVVMKVSANPVGPLLRGAKVTLICQVSSPLPPKAHLCWERVNGTQKDVKMSKQQEVKVEVNVSTAGLWNCHLIVDDDRKISLNYTVEEAPVWISYVAIGAGVGGSLLVFGLACLCIVSGLRWQQRRQRAKRMIRARQYLLENKTCQCQ